MISKYNGTCSICKRPTKARVDQYDLSAKESYHEECKGNVDTLDHSTAFVEAEALALKLGYKPPIADGNNILA